MKKPLAFRMRPQKIEDIIGQKHLIGENKIITRCLEEKQLFSMIFYGPPGTGKTTLAMVLANELDIKYRLFNAVTGNKKELDIIFEEAKFFPGMIVIIDEVHRLNKDKQDLLLPHIENGSIIMIGATTANPLFSINPAIRSRTHLFEIKALQKEDIVEALKRAVKSPDGLNDKVKISDKALALIATQSNGDIRYALNILEICSVASNDIDEELVEKYAFIPNISSDSDGDYHYDLLSAFQKSIRGSDVDAALYYLAILIEIGDLESIERRLLVTAYEDIGLANPAAVSRCIQAIDASKRVGFPEGRIPLAHTIIDLCLSPKSKSAINAIDNVKPHIKNHAYPVPSYLRLTPVGMKEEDKYDYSRLDLVDQIQYLPDELKNESFYHPNENSQYEKALASNWKKLKQKQRTSKLANLKKR
ncbi:MULTISPECIES: replication-associated recombination protein A [unclassified Breznakia]|uniref:replication-associated recombination protein A n=1 Tax=unclassified Breznakia TaxID=2623764 RepID=UPI002404F304|nr:MULTISPECIES: replication-associated recombination protein A [unclassified Breznakia]MDL2276804.1 replication-associated recombination protein A [Breznakia sp. OttesenSCG-928-G09]